MTIELALKPDEESKLAAIARSKGVSAGDLLREALDGILAGALTVPETQLTGASLVAAMQASPYKDVDLGAGRHHLPVRDLIF